jgi:phage terminase Nu1 subunit (DNA packaging protein)
MSVRYLSKSKLSELTGKDRRTIDKVLSGLKPNSVEGRAQLYDTQLVLPLIFEVESDRSLDRQLQEEQLRHEKGKADKVELEVRKRKGELVEVEDVAKAWEKVLTAVRAELFSIPVKSAHPLAPGMTPAEVKKHLEDAINEALTTLSVESLKKINEIEENEKEEENAGEQLREETPAKSAQRIKSKT